MDIHQSLNWKQVVTHPVIGLLILAGLIGSWFLYRQARRSRLQT